MAGKLFSSDASAVIPNIPQGSPVDAIPPLNLPSSLGTPSFSTTANGGMGGGGGFANSGYGQAIGSLSNSVSAILGGNAQQQNYDNVFGIVGGLGNMGMDALNQFTGMKDLSGGMWGGVANVGTSILSKALGKSMNYDDKAGQAFSAVTGMIKKAGPWGLAIGTALDVANMIGGTTVKGTTTDTVNTKEVGSAYDVSGYELDDMTVSGVGRIFGADRKRRQEVVEKQRKLDRIADIGADARTDRLRTQGSIQGITSRNNMELSGGYRTMQVKKGGILVNVDFLKEVKAKMQDGGDFKTPTIPADFVERMEAANGTKGTIGSDSKNVESKNKKATENGIKKAQKEGNKNSLNLGLNNLLNLYGNNVVSAQEGVKVKKPHTGMNMKEFFDYIVGTGRWTDKYDYKRFYQDTEAFSSWVNEELKGIAHFTDKYKNPKHPTYSNEATGYDKKGGRWEYDNQGEIFYPEQWQVDQFGGWDRYQEAVKREYGTHAPRLVKPMVPSAQEGVKINPEMKYVQPGTYQHNPGFLGGWNGNKDPVLVPVPNPNYKKDNSKKAFVKDTYGTANSGVLGFKKGGAFNIIPGGALHKERHHMEDNIQGMDHVTRKGIPVVTTNKAGEMKQQAEIERDEIIFNKELSEKLEALKKAYEDGDDNAAIEAGKLLSEEILFNTKDYTGLIKQTKTA